MLDDDKLMALAEPLGEGVMALSALAVARTGSPTDPSPASRA